MDSLHMWGITVIQQIQMKLQNYDRVLLTMSHLGDPRFAFTIYFPVAYVLHQSIGKRVLCAAVISEWLNAVAKWLLHGERPYWWVHESGLYTTVPHLKQFNITCETGPGSPSGHAMITSAVWYILISDTLYYKNVKSGLAQVFCWFLFASIMAAVCVSRLFIATHFPHQVIAGIVVGIILARTINTLSTTSLKLQHYLGAALGLSVCATAVYFFIVLLGTDPLWSLTVATKWCALKEWVRLDTTLFYSIVRDVSSLVALGVGVWLSGPDDKKKGGNTGAQVVQILIALAVTMASDRIKLPHSNMLFFYILAFVKTFVVICSIVTGVSFVQNI